MDKKKVYVTRRIPDQNIERLKTLFDLEINPEDRALTRQELKERIKGKDGVIAMLTDTIDGEVLDAAGPQLKIVANYAVGFNNMDLKAATQRGVVLTNTPGVLDEATATLSFTLLLSVARRICESDVYVREGKWTGWAPTQFIGLDIANKTLGIAGLGRIGMCMARKACAFDMQVIYTSNSPKPSFEKEYGARFVDKETLLKESDFLSLHIPLLPETRHYIGEKELQKMKKTAVIINAARGPVIDEVALVKALKERTIWGAGLDVYENEPALTPGLTELPNVILAPHTGSATLETRVAMGNIAINNIIKVLEGQKPETCINPDVLAE